MNRPSGLCPVPRSANGGAHRKCRTICVCGAGGPTGELSIMLELNLLGVPEVTLDGQALTFTRRGSIALLAYLALSRRAHAREALATLLAGDSFEEQARKYLSNVLVDLRQQVGE